MGGVKFANNNMGGNYILVDPQGETHYTDAIGVNRNIEGSPYNFGVKLT